MSAKTHVLKVFGELACFTSPFTKVERLSQPCLTPSAARGILDSIYLKPPEFRWQVDRIDILAPIRYIALRRNEVKEKVSFVPGWVDGSREIRPIFADADKAFSGSDQKGRTQRQTMALKDVEYLIYAHIVPFPGTSASLTALDEQFVRRAKSGKCFMQPAFGNREFPAYFEYIDADEPIPKPEEINMDLGWLVYDVFDLNVSNKILCTGTIDKKSPNFKRYISKPSVSVFRGNVEHGIFTIPPYDSPLVRKATSLESEVNA